MQYFLVKINLEHETALKANLHNGAYLLLRKFEKWTKIKIMLFDPLPDNDLSVLNYQMKRFPRWGDDRLILFLWSFDF